MIKAISSKYCQNNLIQLIPSVAPYQLIISADEILLLREGDNVLVNKYLEHPSRDLFRFREREVHIKETSKLNHQLYEYNKTYLTFKASDTGYSLQKEYFFKGSNRALWLNEDLPIEARANEEYTEELSREELEKRFNSNEYDSMYIIYKNGKVLHAYNKKDGYIVKSNIIPTDKEIIDLELRNRNCTEEVANIISKIFDKTENKKIDNSPKTIDEIKNLNIYAPIMYGKYSHILITSKDGYFQANWFKLEFIKKDRFKLTTGNIPVSEPTVDYVINYSKKYPIENTYTLVDTEQVQEIPDKPKVRKRRKQRKFEKYLNGILSLEDFKNHI